MGVPNQDFGFGNSNAPTAAANGGYMEGITPNLPVKYYFNPNAMDGSSTSGHYFYQNPMPRTVTTSNTQMPPAVAQPPQNNNIQANVGFVANQPALTVAGQAQVNAIAQQIQNTVNQNTGPVATQVQTQPIQNSEGLPGTVTTVTQNQPIQIVTVTSNVTISLATSMQANNPNAAPLLQQRYNNIRAQLINQGVPAANISMAPLGPQSFGLQGAPNQTTFNIQTNTTTQNGTQTTTTTTTKDYTYGE